MASTRDGAQYQAIQPHYGNDRRGGGFLQAAPSRGAFILPSLQVVDEELAIEYLGIICIYFAVFGFAFLAVGAIAIVLPILFAAISVPQMVAFMLVIGDKYARRQHVLVDNARLVFGAWCDQACNTDVKHKG